MEPMFFATPAEFYAWLEVHHATAQELLVGYYKTSSGKPSMTWSESVDQALCFGWIDGVRRSIDGESYSIRFTPRKAGSTWSKVNIDKVAVLTEQGMMRPAGIAAFENRKEAKSGIYSYEQRDNAVLSEDEQQRLEANPQAWEYFQSKAGSYQKAATWWVVSAKKDETREKRLATLIELSGKGEMLPHLIPRRGKT